MSKYKKKNESEMSKIMISTTCREGTTLGSRIRQCLFPDTFFEKGSTLFATMRAAFSVPWIRQYLPKTRVLVSAWNKS